nr:beta-ketoacyl-[acyl-carrier-protein] synthase family protein [Streptomyces acidiscabies]
MNSSDRRVVVTGLGATTPLGGTASDTWQGLIEGRSAIRLLDHPWTEDVVVRFGAEIAVEPEKVLPRTELRKLDRSAQFALIAAREAWADAGFTGPAGDGGEADPDRVGVALSASVGGVTSMLHQYDILKEQGFRKVSPHTIPMMLSNTQAANVGLELNARAGVHAASSACASGAESIAYAIEMIRTGRADVVVAGGTEAAICALNMAAFGNMMAMSKRNDAPERASRPYDTDRDGFVIAEGCGVVVLESAEHAERRGARVYAEAVGQAMSSDSHHITQPEPSGRGIAAALCTLLDTTDLTPAQIVHVNAHATSTPKGDVAEIKALRKVFGDATDHFAVSATKSMTGHLLGGAGGVETVAAVLAVHHRLAPPTINIENLDPEVEADIVRDEPRALPDGRIAALNNSFGFGGHNVVLAFRTP